MWRSAGIGPGRRTIRQSFRSGCSWIMCGCFNSKYENKSYILSWRDPFAGQRLFVQQEGQHAESTAAGQHDRTGVLPGCVLADQSGYECPVTKTEYGFEFFER